MTGCGSEEGIGFASARLLARLGARVAIIATTDRIEARAEELRADGADVTAHAADLTDRAQTFALAGAAGGELVVTNEAHNNFMVSGFFASQIAKIKCLWRLSPREGRTDPLTRQKDDLFVVVYIEKNGDTAIDLGEYEYLVLDF